MRANKESICKTLCNLMERMSNNRSLGRWHTVRCGVLNMYISDHIVNTRHEYLVSAFYRDKLFFSMTYTEHDTVAKLINSHDTDFWAIELFAQWLAVLKYGTKLTYRIESLSTVDRAREQYLCTMIDTDVSVTGMDTDTSINADTDTDGGTIHDAENNDE